MSRHGYSDDMDDQWALIRCRGAVKSSIRGKRGQAFLKELITGLDALPEKILIVEELEQDGQVCALGSVGRLRGMDMSKVDPEDFDSVKLAFGIPEALAREIMYENDEYCRDDADRWQRMRKWATDNLAEDRP